MARIRLAPALASIAAVAMVPGHALAAAPVALPDLRIIVPTDLISIGIDPSSGDRELRFTHITADVGKGPFEIDPRYDSRTGTSRFVQLIYNSPRPGVWDRDHAVPIGVTGVWEPPSDYQFPLTRFTLNRANRDGSPGAVVATSPKKDYCITGDYRLTGVPNTPDETFIAASNCNDPTQPLGWSVGWGDEYDQTDAGQPIDLSGVRDGTYILHAIVDPRRVLVQSNPDNDVADTKLRIRGDNITVLSQTHPGSRPSAGPRVHVRSVRWRHGVLTLVVAGVPKNGKLSVRLEFAHRHSRSLIVNGNRLRVRTPRPVLIVIRLVAGRRPVGKTITIRLSGRLTVRIANPTAGETISGTVPVVADVSGESRIVAVQFAIDGRRIGRPVTAGPYVIHWSTKHAAAGRHRISARVTDARGATATASVVVDIQNPAPPMTCFVLQAHVNAHGHGIATTRAIHTAMPAETLVALVSADGPAGARQQSATVTGAGLRWRLVRRANSSSGDSEIWTARAPRVLSGARITSSLGNRSFDASLSVVALEGTRGVGAASAASGSSGAARLELTTRSATSLVFAVGNDWDRSIARVLPIGWVRLDQWLDTRIGDTFWSQYTNQPTGRRRSVVTVGVASPTTDQWNLAAVEVLNDGS